MRKLIGMATIVVAGVSVGGTAFAGEGTGGPNPKPTPIDVYNGRFDLLVQRAERRSRGRPYSAEPNDPNSPLVIDPLSVGRVQSWGQTLNLAAATFLPEGTKGKSALTGNIHAFGPGASCRG